MKIVKPILIVTILFALAIVLEIKRDPYENIKMFSVQACVETLPTHPLQDAEDMCIWIHPGNPSMSTIICTDKEQGIVVYDLSGQEIQFLPAGRINNIDIRSGFPFKGQNIDLIVASSRLNNSFVLYTVDPETRQLIPLPPTFIPTNLSKIYGLCMYKNRSNSFYVFATSTSGMVEQWEIFDGKNDSIGAKMVRQIRASSKAEGCVADDELGFFYLSEEKQGIWKFEAEPDAGHKGTLIAKVTPALLPDIEGLTIYYGDQSGMGYLIASSQGSSKFAIYDRTKNNVFQGLFDIVDGNTIDGTLHTDGIDVTGHNLGEKFPQGLFVAQDGLNRDGDPSNFKMVSLSDILQKILPQK